MKLVWRVTVGALSSFAFWWNYYLNYFSIGTLSPTSFLPFGGSCILMYGFWTHEVSNPETPKLPLFSFRFFFLFCVYAPCVRKSWNPDVAGPTLPFCNLGKFLTRLLAFETLKPRVPKYQSSGSHFTFLEPQEMSCTVVDIWNTETLSFEIPKLRVPPFLFFTFHDF